MSEYTSDGSGRRLSSPPPPSTVISRKAFWRRWTRAEREAFQDMLATGTQPQKNKLGAFRVYIDIDNEIDLSDQEVIDGLQALPAAVLTGARATIIATP